MANVAELRVGRLVEVSVDSAYRTADDVHAVFAAIAQIAQRVQSKKIVLVADWRRCPIMSEAASKAFADLMRKNNDRVERSAALVGSESPSAMLQFVRMVREADNLNRRLFSDKLELGRWLDEVLDPAEQKRLAEFLDRP